MRRIDVLLITAVLGSYLFANAQSAATSGNWRMEATGEGEGAFLYNTSTKEVWDCEGDPRYRNCTRVEFRD